MKVMKKTEYSTSSLMLFLFVSFFIFFLVMSFQEDDSTAKNKEGQSNNNSLMRYPSSYAEGNDSNSTEHVFQDNMDSFSNLEKQLQLSLMIDSLKKAEKDQHHQFHHSHSVNQLGESYPLNAVAENISLNEASTSMNMHKSLIEYARELQEYQKIMQAKKVEDEILRAKMERFSKIKREAEAEFIIE